MRKHLKSITTCLMILGLVLVSASVAMASEAAGAAPTYERAIVIGCSVIAAAIAIGFGAIGAGTGMGQATSGSASAVGRNPDAQGKILLTMLVGMAMTESITIYALVVALVILYANPLLKIVFG
ncbi:MAG TPA: ATP synthase F0 subunit C [Desulfobacterales bacterium]|nr:ATP synthase F0 subunit C [Desulfobacterales bacterium]